MNWLETIRDRESFIKQDMLAIESYLPLAFPHGTLVKVNGQECSVIGWEAMDVIIRSHGELISVHYSKVTHLSEVTQ